MKIAIPLSGGRLAPHFGHCEEFALFDVGEDPGEVPPPERLDAPPHQPGLLPRYLREHGADVIIAGGMGRRAQQLFSQAGIEVVVGAQASDPTAIVTQYLNEDLATGPNLCAH